MTISITKQTGYANTTALSGRAIKYIVIHYTAGSTSKTGAAYNNAVRFSNPSVGASADFIVDDTTAVQYNPDIKNRYCWHCGDNKAYTKGGSYYGKCTNANSIGIEVCCTNPKWSTSTPANSPDWSFTEAVVNKAVELTKYLMQTYNIPADRVIRHYDVSGKLCPGIIGWNEDSGDVSAWKAFKARLTGSSTSSTTSTPTSSKPDIYYQVYTDQSGWLPKVKNLDDYAGEDGEAIKGIRVFLDGDTLAVETHQMSNGSIDKLTIYAGKHTVRYRVRVLGQSNYLDYMENKKDTGGSSDTYAGIAGKGIDRLQIVVK